MTSDTNFDTLVKTIGLKETIKQLGLTDKKLKQTANSAGVLDRALKGTAQATSSSTKAFAKQAQGMGGLVHVYATVAANVFALSSAYLVLKRNADLSILSKSSETLSKSTGTNFKYIAAQMKDITNGALSIHDAMRQANLALAGGLSTVQLKEITSVATKAAAATGRSVAESVQRMVQAVVKGEPELVDEFGIILRVGKATEDYAIAHNKAASSLTTFERQQAIANQAIERGNAVYKDIKLEDIVNNYEKLQSTVTELGNSIIGIVGGPIGGLASVLNKNSTLILTIITLIAATITKKAIPSLNNFAETFIQKNKAIAKNSKKTAIEAKENLSKISDGYGQYIRSTKGLASEVRAALKDTEIPVPAPYRTNKNVITQFARSVSGPYKKEFISMMKQLDSTTNKHIDFLGKKITRERANSLLIAVGKEEDILRRGLGSQFKLHKEYTAAVKQTISQTTKHYINELKYRNAATKQFAAQGMAEGYSAGIRGSVALGSDIKSKVVGATGSKVMGTLAKASTIASGLLGTVVNIGSKLIGWVFAVQIISSLVGPIANSLGLWDSSIGEAVDAVNDLDKLLKTQKNRLTGIEVASKNINITYDDRVRIAKTEISILGEVRDSLVKIEKAGNKIGETNWFQAWFTKNSNLDDISKSLREQEQILNRLGIKQSKYDISGIIKAYQVEKLNTGTRVVGVEDIEYNFKITGLKNSRKQVEDLWDTLSLAQQRLNPNFVPNMLGAISKSLGTVVKTAQTDKEKIVASFNSIEQASRTLSDTINKKRTAAGAQGPWSTLLGQFKTIKDNLVTAGIYFNEQGIAIDKNNNKIIEGHELFENFKGATEGLPKIFKKSAKSIEGIIAKFKELQKLQIEYATSKSIIDAETQNIILFNLEIERGSISAINSKYEANRRITRQKVTQVNQQIESTKQLLVEGKNSISLLEKINSLETKRNVLIGVSREKYSKVRQEIEIIDKLFNNKKVAIELEIISSESFIDVANTAINDTTETLSNRITALYGLEEAQLQNIMLAWSSASSNIDRLETIENKSGMLSSKQQMELEKSRNVVNTTNIKTAKVMRDNLNREMAILKEKYNKQAQTNIAEKTFNKSILEYSEKKRNNENITFREKLRMYRNEERLLLKNIRLDEQTLTNKIKANNSDIAFLNKHTKLDKDKLIRDNLLLNNKKLASDQMQIQVEFERQSLAIALEKHELMKESSVLGDANFVDTVQKELDIMHKSFKRNMLTDAKAVVRFIREPITSALDALTSGLLEGSVTVTEILKNSLKAGYDSIVDIIMKKMADNFQSALLNWAKDSEQLSSLFGATKEDKKLIIAESQLGVLGEIYIVISKMAASLGASVGTTSGVLDSLLKNVVGGFTNSSGTTSSLSNMPGTSGSFADAFDSFKFAKGGIMSALGAQVNTYGKGGIATTPQVAIFGEGRQHEAYIPLPDNKTVPVTLTGIQPNQNFNININIEADGNTTEQSDSHSNISQLTKLIANGTKNVIIQESRPGGLLRR